MKYMKLYLKFCLYIFDIQSANLEDIYRLSKFERFILVFKFAMLISVLVYAIVSSCYITLRIKY